MSGFFNYMRLSNKTTIICNLVLIVQSHFLFYPSGRIFQNERVNISKFSSSSELNVGAWRSTRALRALAVTPGRLGWESSG